MKKILFICFILLFNSIVFGQTNIQSKNKSFGLNHLNNKEIQGTEFIFPERIHDVYFDTISSLLTLQLRGISNWSNNNGQVISFDLKQGEVIWSNSINYQSENIIPYHNFLIKYQGKRSYCLDSETGLQLWEIKNSIYYANPSINIGIGYDNYTIKDNLTTVSGIDMNNGTKIWERNISREYTWNEILQLNDEEILVAAAGLHTINLKTGKGWDYNTITGETDYPSTVVENLVSPGSNMYYCHNVLRDAVSNVLIDSTHIYFASTEKITCLNRSGKVIWTYPMPRKWLSKSTLFKQDSSIYIINRGYAFIRDRIQKHGIPFIMALNPNNGRRRFLDVVKSEIPIFNFQIDKDTVVLLLKDKVEKHSLQSGTIIQEKNITLNKGEYLEYFIGNQVFIEKDSTFKRLLLTDTTKYFVYTTDNKIIALDHQLAINKVIERKNIFISHVNSDNYRFLTNEDSTIILNKNMQKLATLNVTQKLVQIDKKLYGIKENKLICIDLSEQLNKQ